VTSSTLRDAISEAERFLERGRAIPIVRRNRCESGDWYETLDTPNPQVSAAKRASMDLTRALARMRSRK
jgi:hypothetical protein